jgi:3-hydroxybutyryl-CoA dehydrogenase
MRIDDLRRVLIVGTGGIGRQIAVSCATHGYAVTLYDVNPQALQSALAACRSAFVDAGGASYQGDQPGGRCPAPRSPIPPSAEIRATSDPREAGRDADLLIESVPEQLPLKRSVFAQFAQICPPHAVFTTNTSVFLPSMFLKESGRPEKLAALHFIMGSNLTEIMPHARTSPETVELLEGFSRCIGHVSVTCKREQPGHLVNTMLMALNNAALTLAANGVAGFEDIDRAWMKATHERRGPFGLLDLVGLKTALEITEYGSRVTGSPQVKKNAEYLKAVVDQGGLGLNAGQGFYTYPNPAFEQPEFLEPK